MMRKTKGFGLIEVMISLLVSVVIMAGLYGLLTSSIVGFGFSKASSNAVEAGHRVDSLLNTMLFQAGFVNYNRLINDQGFAKGNVTAEFNDILASWNDGQFIYSPNNSNQILLRFFGSSLVDDTSNFGTLSKDLANGFITDCNGTAVSRDQIVTVLLSVSNNSLVCSYVTDDATGAGGATVQEVVIDPTVRDIRFEFGSTFDKAFATNNLTQGFFSAEQINDHNLKWSSIDVVRYSFVTSQPSNQRLLNNPNVQLHHFNNPDAGYVYTVRNEDAANVHRVITGTIYLVNTQKPLADNTVSANKN